MTVKVYGIAKDNWLGITKGKKYPIIKVISTKKYGNKETDVIFINDFNQLERESEETFIYITE